MDGLIDFESAWVLAFQSLPGLTALMRAASFLGSEEFYLFIMPALYWCVDAGLGARTAVMLIFSNSLSNWLKLSLVQPRPYWVDARVAMLATETSYGQPSGHTLNAVNVWGLLAARVGRRWAWLAAGGLMVLIALSRVYLGVHFPSNLLGGWLIGGLSLWAFLRWEARATAWLGRLGLGGQLALAGLISLGYLTGSWALLTVFPAPAELPAWAAAAARAGQTDFGPRNPEALINLAGMLAGLGAGLALMTRHARFEAGGPPLQRGLRFILGVAGVAGLFFGLRLVLPQSADWIGYAGRYFRYGAVVFWALYLAPLLFLKLGLARPAAPPGSI